ncbi:MAG: hypothetical protein M9949_10190 [Candidatus Kapabacteria bacterium]|nr:hypothetical protein [Candidatus Kapabacteria bacterium]
MKKSINLLALLTLLFVVSCGDIVDSDDNIKKTAVTYAKVLENQETGVILPLKVGNKWLYTVDELNENELVFRKRADSIVVISELTLDDGIWFEVYFPLISKKENVLMTNTEKGLWVRCEQCENKSFLWAEYPYQNKLFYVMEKHFVISDSNGDTLAEDFGSIGKTAQSASIKLSNGQEYETIKYDVFAINKEKMITQLHLGDEHYVPDFGLVSSYIKPYSKMIGENYELVQFINEEQEDKSCVFDEYINLGEIRKDSLVTISKEIINTTNNSFKLKGIAIIPATEIISFGKFKPSMHEWLNASLKPGQTQSIEIKVTPDKLGEFSTTVMIIYSDLNKCFYNILIEGTCIE